MKKLLGAAAVAATLYAAPASAAILTFNFTDGGDVRVSSVVQSQSGLTLTVTGTTYGGSSRSVWKDGTSLRGYGVVPTSGSLGADEINGGSGTSNDEVLKLAFSSSVKLLSITFVDGDHDQDFNDDDDFDVMVGGIGSGFVTLNEIEIEDNDLDGVVNIADQGPSTVFGIGGDESDNSFYVRSITVEIPDVVRVPEPMTLGLFGSALVGLGLLRRRKKA